MINNDCEGISDILQYVESCLVVVPCLPQSHGNVAYRDEDISGNAIDLGEHLDCSVLIPDFKHVSADVMD